MPYLKIRGKVYVAPVTNGTPGVFRDVGNVDGLEVNLSNEVYEHYEKRTGNDLIDFRLSTKNKAELKIVLQEFSKENMALAMYGTSTLIAASTVTAEAFPTVAVGDIVRLKKLRASSIVIKDSAATPATLVAGTDYEVVSADHGTIKILSLGSYTQPFKADYSAGTATNMNMFTGSGQELWVKVDGKNMADGGKPVLCEFYKFSAAPTATLSIIADSDITSFDLTGSALYDGTKETDTTLGQFGRIVQLY